MDPYQPPVLDDPPMEEIEREMLHKEITRLNNTLTFAGLVAFAGVVTGWYGVLTNPRIQQRLIGSQEWQWIKDLLEHLFV